MLALKQQKFKTRLEYILTKILLIYGFSSAHVHPSLSVRFVMSNGNVQSALPTCASQRARVCTYASIFASACVTEYACQCV